MRYIDTVCEVFILIWIYMFEVYPIIYHIKAVRCQKRARRRVKGKVLQKDKKKAKHRNRLKKTRSENSVIYIDF